MVVCLFLPPPLVFYAKLCLPHMHRRPCIVVLSADFLEVGRVMVDSHTRYTSRNSHFVFYVLSGIVPLRLEFFSPYQ